MNMDRLREHLEITKPIAREAFDQLGNKLVIVKDGMLSPNIAIIVDDQYGEDWNHHHPLTAIEVARVLAYIQEAGYQIMKEEDIPF